MASQPEAEAEALRQLGELARMEFAERIRRHREYYSLPAKTGRVVHGLWRSIITGGWE